MKKFSWYTTNEKDRHGRYVGAKVFGEGGPFAFCKCYENFKPNRKGGRRHNATRNALHRRVIRSKNARKTSRKNRMKWKQRGANG